MSKRCSCSCNCYCNCNQNYYPCNYVNNNRYNSCHGQYNNSCGFNNCGCGGFNDFPLIWLLLLSGGFDGFCGMF